MPKNQMILGWKIWFLFGYATVESCIRRQHRLNSPSPKDRCSCHSQSITEPCDLCSPTSVMKTTGLVRNRARSGTRTTEDGRVKRVSLTINLSSTCPACDTWTLPLTSNPDRRGTQRETPCKHNKDLKRLTAPTDELGLHRVRQA